MTPPHFSFDVNLGQVLVGLLLAMLGWGLRQTYRLAARFVDRVNTSEDLLQLTTAVVDDHSRALVRRGDLETITRLHHRRRLDPEYFTKDDLT